MLIEHQTPVESARTGPDDEGASNAGTSLILIDGSPDAVCADDACAVAPSAESPAGQ